MLSAFLRFTAAHKCAVRRFVLSLAQLSSSSYGEHTGRHSVTVIIFRDSRNLFWNLLSRKAMGAVTNFETLSSRLRDSRSPTPFYRHYCHAFTSPSSTYTTGEGGRKRTLGFVFADYLQLLLDVSLGNTKNSSHITTNKPTGHALCTAFQAYSFWYVKSFCCNMYSDLN